MSFSTILKPYEQLIFDLLSEKSNVTEIYLQIENEFENFEEYLIKNKLLPLFFEYFSKLDNGNNNLIYNKLKASDRSFVLRQMQLEGAFRTIVPLLHNAGVEVIAIKGIHLSSAIYQQPYHRPMIDIDLLIRKTDVEIAHARLLAHGAISSPIESEHTMGLWQHLPPLRYNGVSIELHSNLVVEHQYPNFLIDRFFETAISTELYHVHCKSLNCTYHFFYLCLHAFKHTTFRGFQAIWLVDIFYFAKTYENEIDIDLFISLCNVNNCTLNICKVIGAVNFLFATSFFVDKLTQTTDEQFIRNTLDNCAGVYISSKSSIKTFKNVRQINGYQKKVLFVIGKLFPSAAYVRHRFHLEGRFSTIKGFYLLYKRYILKMLQMLMR